MIPLNRLLALAATTAALGISATPAAASGVAIDDGMLRFTAAPGESNDALVAPGDEGGLIVADSGSAPAAPGAGCEPADGFALCGDARELVLDLGDADDVASVDGAVVLPATIDGGDGSDSISAGGGVTLLRGGAGDDFLNGGEAGDSVDPGPGPDYVISAGGDDTIAARDGEADSISCGEGDDTVSADLDDSVDPDCERVSTSGTAPVFGPPAGGASDLVADGGTAGGSGGSTKRSERASCMLKRRWISCAVRLRNPATTGRFDVTLKRGPVLFARARGKVVGGTFRVRMRLRGRIPNGSYKLRATVQPDGAKPFRRMWRVGVLVLGR